MPFNVRRPGLSPDDYEEYNVDQRGGTIAVVTDIRTKMARRPQTLEQAYEWYIGYGNEEPDWESYEDAVDKILRGIMPTSLGHHPSCEPGRYPMALFDTRTEVRPDNNGVDQPVVVCRHCGYVLG